MGWRSNNTQARPTSLFRHRIIDSRFFSSCFRASRPVLSFLSLLFSSVPPFLILTRCEHGERTWPDREAPSIPISAGAPRLALHMGSMGFSSRAFTLPGRRFPISVFTIRFPVFPYYIRAGWRAARNRFHPIGGPVFHSVASSPWHIMGKGVPMKILTGD